MSIAGIRNLGVVPDANTVENNKIKRAKISSASSCFEINAEKQRVMVPDRRALDKQIAFQAQKKGAEIRVKCSMRSLSKDSSDYIVRTTEGEDDMQIFCRCERRIIHNQQSERRPSSVGSGTKFMHHG